MTSPPTLYTLRFDDRFGPRAHARVAPGPCTRCDSFPRAGDKARSLCPSWQWNPKEKDHRPWIGLPCGHDLEPRHVSVTTPFAQSGAVQGPNPLTGSSTSPPPAFARGRGTSAHGQFVQLSLHLSKWYRLFRSRAGSRLGLQRGLSPMLILLPLSKLFSHSVKVSLCKKNELPTTDFQRLHLHTRTLPLRHAFSKRCQGDKMP